MSVCLSKAFSEPLFREGGGREVKVSLGSFHFLEFVDEGHGKGISGVGSYMYIL